MTSERRLISHYNREIKLEERFSKFFKIWWT